MRIVVRAVLVLALCAASVEVRAMPNFTRREGFDCSACHVNIPRLTRFGYEFRNSGFRVPSTIGDKNQKSQPDFGTMNTARIQSDAEWHAEHGRGAERTGGQLTFLEATLYPVTGSWGRWGSSEGELSVAPEDFFEVENAWVRGTFGGEKMRFNVRAGVFHPWEGYGASDRPLSIARPTFQRSAARFAPGGQNITWYTPWGFDQAGVEGGFTFGGFNVAATLFNGLFVEGDPALGEAQAFPFQGGELVRNRADRNYNKKDYQLFANQFFGDAAISAHWYHGNLSVPVTGPVPTGTYFTDQFDRVSVYGTLPLEMFFAPGKKKARPVIPMPWILAGFEHGWDTGFNPGTLAKTNKFSSQGWFGEVWVPYNQYVGAAVRYDNFDSSRRIQDNTQQVVTGALNVAALNGAQGILEYRHVLTELNAVNNRNRDQLELRLIYIF
jgi:hypothetical protein